MTRIAVYASLPMFDLSYVVEQLSQKSEFSRWSKERFTRAVEEYKKFLGLCKQYPDQPLIPSPDVDSIWHRHILNTKRYMVDSQSYFGYYLHHSPHPRVELGTKVANDGWLNTLYLYEQMFGSKPPEGWLAQSGICNGGGCDSAACSPGGEIHAFTRSEISA